MSLSIRTEGTVTIASFADDRILDEMLIQKLGAELISLTQDDNVKHIALNFEKVEFMSSAMIGKLVLMNKKCSAAGKSLRLCSINGNLMEVFKLTNLDKVFTIDPDEASAIAGFGG